jgi:hypothetical protein
LSVSYGLMFKPPRWNGISIRGFVVSFHGHQQPPQHPLGTSSTPGFWLSCCILDGEQRLENAISADIINWIFLVEATRG